MARFIHSCRTRGSNARICIYVRIHARLHLMASARAERSAAESQASDSVGLRRIMGRAHRSLSRRSMTGQVDGARRTWRQRGGGGRGEQEGEPPNMCARCWPIDPRLKTRVVRYALRSRVTQSATITYTYSSIHTDSMLLFRHGLLPSLLYSYCLRTPLIRRFDRNRILRIR